VDGLPPCSRTSYSQLTVSPFFAEDGILFLLDSTMPHPQTLYRSRDGGEHWEAILRPQAWYDHAAIRQFAIAPMRSPQGLILYARAALWYTGGSTYALLRSVDNGDTWSIDQMCDESLAYCRNWVGFYLTNQTNVWFVPRVQTYVNFEADIQRWDNSPWFPQVDTVWNETGAYGLSISPDYASDHLLYPATGATPGKTVQQRDCVRGGRRTCVSRRRLPKIGRCLRCNRARSSGVWMLARRGITSTRQGELRARFLRQLLAPSTCNSRRIM